MNRCFALAAFVTFCSALPLQAAVVGEASPLATGTPDSWSGVTVMNGYGGIPVGEQVTTVSFYAADDRASTIGTHNVQPIIAREEGGIFTIWDVGPVATPASTGEHSLEWSSRIIPNDGNTYHPGFWQWRDFVDNDAGGVVAFGDGGSGMFQSDRDGTSYVPAVGDPLDMGHSSGAGGRAYQFNVMTAVPEPATALLASLALLPLLMLHRRRK